MVYNWNDRVDCSATAERLLYEVQKNQESSISYKQLLLLQFAIHCGDRWGRSIAWECVDEYQIIINYQWLHNQCRVEGWRWTGHCHWGYYTPKRRRMMIIRHIKECFPLNNNKQQETTEEHCRQDVVPTWWLSLSLIHSLIVELNSTFPPFTVFKENPTKCNCIQ